MREPCGIRDDGKTPLFRTARGRTGALTGEPMHRIDAYRMIRRRAAEAGFKQKLGCHVFRATGITAYLEAGGTLENAQAMAAHESPRTTKLYDRTGDEVTLDEIEIKQDRQVIVFAQLIPESVKDPLSLFCEATEDQDRLLSDGVDDVADLLIVQQQIDELRNFDFVNGDLGLAIWCDD